MTDAKHTPGPWAAFDNGMLIGVGIPGKDGSHDIAHVCDGHVTMQHAFANARLIAAAPGLLDALMDAVEQYGNSGGPWNVPNDPGGWLHKARAAIAKAEDGSQ